MESGVESMFKKLVALTLAALMLLNPMTAFAVSWNTVVTALRETKSFSEDGIKATATEDGAVIVSGDGTIENFFLSKDFSSYTFTGTITINNQEFGVWVDNDSETPRTVAVNVESGATLNAEELRIGADGKSALTFRNEGTFIGNLYGSASNGANVGVWNYGTLDGNAEVAAILGGRADAYNSGAVTGNLSGVVIDGKKATMINDGTVEGEYGLYVQGEDSYGAIENEETGKAGSMTSTATDEAEALLYNAGTVDGEVFVAADNAEANVENRACGTMDSLYAFAVGSGTLNVKNDGAITDRFVADIYDDASVAASGTGTVKNATIYINTPSADTFSPKEIKEILSKVNLPEETLVDNELWTCDSEGNFTARYRIDENGVITLIESFVKSGSGEGDDPATWTKERIRHDMEEKRKAQAIGGVYGSPYWLKQLYLGYMSLNLRLFEGEERLLFKESLSWLVEERAKQITFRIRLENPENLTMRLDGTVIDVLEQAEISTIAIVDGDGDLFMEYKVADLKGAREMYGLACEDYIVVGAADADVMKIGADGRLVPIEGEEAAEATEAEATAAEATEAA